MKIKFTRNLFRLQIRLIIIGIIFLMLAFIIIIFANYIRNEEYNKIRTQLINEGESFLYLLKDLDMPSIHSLNQTREQLLNSPIYLEARKKLLDYAKQFNIDPSFIYTMIKNPDGKYYFILIGNGEYSLRFDDPFDIGHSVEPFFNKAYVTGKMQVPPVYTDKKGRWMTVVIPMLDQNGKVYAIHEPALRVEFVDKIVYNAVLKSILLPVVMLIIFIIIIWIVLNIIFRPFNRIVDIFKSSTFSTEIDVNSIKATGEFSILKDALGHYIEANKKAQGEIKEILDNIKEGLFLLRENNTIGEIHSNETEKLLGKNKLTDANFFSIIKSSMTEKMFNSTKDYIELMFKKDMNEAMLNELNPLTNIQFNILNEQGIYEQKFLDFNFNRTIEDNQIKNLMVTIKDVSEEVRLSEELKKSEEKSKTEMELLVKILHVNPNLLNDHINEMNSVIKEINTLLKSALDPKEYKNVLKNAFHLIHNLKGNAAMLDLDVIADKAHNFENLISELLAKSEIKGSDFIDFTMKLNDLDQLSLEIKTLTERLSGFQSEFETDEDNYISSIIPYFKKLIKTVSLKNNKKATLDCSELKIETIPTEMKIIFKNIVIQLLRNAVAHGIEQKDVRMQNGKDETGKIFLKGHNDSEKILFSVRDDGKGIDIDAIRDIAIKKNIYPEKKVRSLNDHDIAMLIFTSGISTTINADLISGRGVGMNVINEQIKKLNGKIMMEYKKNEFTEFFVELPLKKY